MYDTTLYMIVYLQVLSYGESAVPLHCHYSQVYSNPE